MLRLIATEFNPPKVKYFVIIGACSDSIACVVLNTLPRYQTTPEKLQGQQYPVGPGDCKCISHESFINCAELRVFPKSVINQILTKEPGRKECILHKKHIENLLSIVKRSKSIVGEDKKKYSL